MRWNRRKDSNHAQIAEALTTAGCGVLDVSGLPNLGCDLVAWRAPNVWLIEIKDGAKPASRRYLTDSEARLKLLYPAEFRIVASVDEALRLVRPDRVPHGRRQEEATS